MKKDLMCVIYVDDTIFAGPDAAKIQDEINSLGVSKFEEQHKFELRDEGEVGDFLEFELQSKMMELSNSLKLASWKNY
jgi:hypothetical protein